MLRPTAPRRALVLGALLSGWAALSACEDDPLNLVDAGFRPDASPDVGPLDAGFVDSGENTEACIEGTLSLPAPFDRDVTFFVGPEEPVARIPTRLGDAFNTLTGGPTPFRCVVGDTELTQGTQVVFDFVREETSSVRSRALSVDVEANVGIAGFKVSSQFKSAIERSVSERDLTITARVRVITSTEEFGPRFELDPSIPIDPLRQPLAFRDRCGDRFVSQITRGGELVVIIRVRARTQSEKESVNARLEGSYQVAGSLSAGFGRVISEKLEGSTVEWFVQRRGGGTARTIPSFQQADFERLFDEYISAFPADVEASPAVVRSYVVSPYSVLGATVCVPDFNPAAAEAISDGWTFLNRIADRRVDVNDALAAPKYFPCVDNEDVPDLRTVAEDLETLETEVADAIDACALELATNPAPACDALNAIIDAASLPEPLLRWDIYETQTAVMGRGSYTWSIAEGQGPFGGELACGPPMSDGRWSFWPRTSDCPGGLDENCWSPCPTPTVDGSTLILTIPDRNPRDNRGQCRVEVGCMLPQNRDKLEACTGAD